MTKERQSGLAREEEFVERKCVRMVVGGVWSGARQTQFTAWCGEGASNDCETQVVVHGTSQEQFYARWAWQKLLTR